MKKSPTSIETIEFLKDEILRKSDNVEKLLSEIRADLNEIKEYEEFDSEEILSIEEKIAVLEKKYKIWYNKYEK